MKTKYPNSKVTLTAISLVAFTTISGWIAAHGPFGASSAAATQAQTQTQSSTRQANVYDDRGYTITQQSSPASSAPVARSRGS